MSARHYSRSDVQVHSDGFRGAPPAVNVKVYDSLEDGWRKATGPGGCCDQFDPGFSVDWIRAHVSEEAIDARFWLVCDDSFELVQMDAEEILGVRAEQVWQEGRSGGWVVVGGLPELEDWDAIQLGKWRKFERFTRDTADYILAGVIDSFYINDYEWEQTEARESAYWAARDVATVAA